MNLQEMYRKSQQPYSHAVAERCQRKPVRVEDFYKHYDPDTTFYVFIEAQAQYGMEPWRIGSGLDLERGSKQTYILEWGATAERRVGPNYEIFVHERDYKTWDSAKEAELGELLRAT